MAGQNTLILANDYNIIQSAISLVMGEGSGTTGYGQTLASSQVGQNAKITVNQWNNLRNDIVRCRQHQTGVTIVNRAPEDPGYVAGSDLPTASEASQIRESWRAAFLSVANDCNTNRLTAPPPASQATRADLFGQQVRTTVWNGRIQQTVVVTFDSANDARYFFNTGGQFEFSSDRSGGSAGLKNTTWTTMLTNMGTIRFNYDATTCTGTGITSTIGYYDITTSDNLIFEKDAPTGSYTPNKYFIYARRNIAGNVITFTLHWWDDSAAPPSLPDPGFGIDENVDGTLTSTVQTFRATGANVSVPNPSATTTPIA
jgi:hypothetical protein